MFKGVHEKLERAAYCFEDLKTLASDAKRLPYIPQDKQQAMRANVDCFFFEIISAKDFFLQGIYDASSVMSLKRHQVTEGSLIACLPDGKAKDAVSEIRDLLDTRKLRPEQKLQDDEYSWLWRLNNYRNSAGHRELVHFHIEAKADLVIHDKPLFNKIKKASLERKLSLKLLKEIAPSVPRVDIPLENVKAYLCRDPEDTEKGHTDIEVIPYCEQSLRRMRNYLEGLYSKLSI